MIRPLAVHVVFLSVACIAGAEPVQTPSAASGIRARLTAQDLQRLRSVTDAQINADGTRIAYTVQRQDGGAAPRTELWIMEVATGAATRVGRDGEPGSAPLWAPDGKRLAFVGRGAQGSGVMVAAADGSSPEWIAPIAGTNAPLPSVGSRLAWSPDGRQLAFLSTTPGPETAAITGDPVVLTRPVYKPTAAEGLARLHDGRRTHIFIADIASRQVRQLTGGVYHEHSIDWSPDGREILFVSNREPDPDRFFNYDIFAVAVGNGTVRRLTSTENAEYRPRWSPDGRMVAYQATRRGITCTETTMEDTQVWLMEASGEHRRDISADIDNRQGGPAWSADGRHVYFTVAERGSVRLYKRAVAGGPADVVAGARGTVGSWSLARNASVAYTFHAPTDLPQLHVVDAGAARRLTNLNDDILSRSAIAETHNFTFMSGDGQFEVEAFLVEPIDRSATSRHPLVVSIHGGPHGQSTPVFALKTQVYAARGFATLFVNFRGSIGYGQRFTDAIFGDQGGREALDVLQGVTAALRRYQWIDPDRMGVEGTSYGGQLVNWLITQTGMFDAAVSISGVSNLISVAYMSYVKHYMQMEFGAMPHQGTLMDLLWERSPLKHVGRVRTPTLLLHGEGDNDVPIAEAEQFYAALHDVGVETVMVRYPREGHGLRETSHVIDSIDRSIAWYLGHFPAPVPSSDAAGRR